MQTFASWKLTHALLVAIRPLPDALSSGCGLGCIHLYTLNANPECPRQHLQSLLRSHAIEPAGSLDKEDGRCCGSARDVDVGLLDAWIPVGTDEPPLSVVVGTSVLDCQSLSFYRICSGFVIYYCSLPCVAIKAGSV